MSRQKHTLFNMTREMLRQFVSCLGYEGEMLTVQKKIVQRGSDQPPEAYDIRMNSEGRKNLQPSQAPR